MKVRVESAPPPGEHKASPILCDGFASRCVHGGKGTFLSVHPDISLYVSFANNEPCAGGAPPRMKLILPYPYFQGKVINGTKNHAKETHPHFLLKPPGASFLPMPFGSVRTMVRFLSVNRQSASPAMSTATSTRKAISAPTTVKSAS